MILEFLFVGAVLFVMNAGAQYIPSMFLFVSGIARILAKHEDES